MKCQNRMPKEPSQLCNMVKLSYSGRWGHDPCWIIKLKMCCGHECPTPLNEKPFTQFTQKSSWSAICCYRQHIHIFDIPRSTLICHLFLFCLIYKCYLVLTRCPSVRTMFPCHKVYSLNQLIWLFFSFFLFITECYKLFSANRKPKEPSQLCNMVKLSYSGKRGHDPCWIKKH
jgi:hypothetical protein